MAEMGHSGFLFEAIVFLLATVVVVPVFERLKASPLVGYLIAGLIIGPNGIGVVKDVENVNAIAELGVVVLMFTIGLEMTLRRLKTMRESAALLGFGQVVLTGLVIGGLAMWQGFRLGPAIVIGAALAVSSTAVVLQLLVERHELATRLGRNAFGILILQDMVIGPLLILIPILSQTGDTVGIALAIAGFKAFVVMAGIVIIGRYVLTPTYRVVAVAQAPELFMALTLFVIVGTALASQAAGLSMALGAFAAGLILAETEHRHRIAETIQPFRGLLMGLFFMAVGMSIVPRLLADNFGLVALMLVGLLLGKALILMLVARLSKHPWPAALRLGLVLAQGGEFAFVILTLAVKEKLLLPEPVAFLVLVVGLSMAATPLLAMAAGWIGKRYEPSEAPGVDGLEQAAEKLDHHVVVAGLGRVGLSVAKRFAKLGQPFLVIESDRRKVVDARARGIPAFHADATDLLAIDAAGVDRAQALIVALGEEQGASHLVATLRYLFPELRIVARAQSESLGRALIRAGADDIVVEVDDAGTRLASAVVVSVDS
jgi:CPA2 family monovalent cation:H+ antiporter-2